MDTAPVAELADITLNLPIDPYLCLICQENSTETLVKNPIQVDNIIELCRQHTDFQTNQYVDLSNRLKITKQELIADISYHAGCYRLFSTAKTTLSVQKLKRENLKMVIPAILPKN